MSVIRVTAHLSVAAFRSSLSVLSSRPVAGSGTFRPLRPLTASSSRPKRGWRVIPLVSSPMSMRLSAFTTEASDSCEFRPSLSASTRWAAASRLFRYRSPRGELRAESPTLDADYRHRSSHRNYLVGVHLPALAPPDLTMRWSERRTALCPHFEMTSTLPLRATRALAWISSKSPASLVRLASSRSRTPAVLFCNGSRRSSYSR